MNCPICGKKLHKETGYNNFYEGLWYCSLCDEYYTGNLNKI